MDVGKYLNLNIDQLEKDLVTDIMAKWMESPDLVKALKETDRYRKDALFCVCVDVGGLIAHLSIQDYTSVFSLSEEVARRAEKLGRWTLVSLAWNQLGGAYFLYGMYERALESYHRVIVNEKRHGLYTYRTLAYNNIALIYMNLNGEEKAKLNFQAAIESLKAGGEDQPRYLPKLVVCLSNLAVHYVLTREAPKAQKCLEEIEKIDVSKFNPDVSYSFYRATLYYYFYAGDIEKGKDNLQKAFDAMDGNLSFQVLILTNFLLHCQKHGVDPSLYKEPLAKLLNYEDRERELSNAEFALILQRHYQGLRNREKALYYRDRYVVLLEEYLESIRLSRLNSLSIVEGLLQTEDSVAEETVKNSRLTHVAEEAVQSKNESQRAYRQIDLVHQLGQKLTSSMNLDLVVELIYENLKENLPLDSFILMVSDEKKRQLRSVAYYEDERKLPEFSLVWDDPKSLFARCFRTKGSIVIKDFSKDPPFSYREILWNGAGSVRSGVFLPLTVEGEVIGVFSVQARKLDAYGKSDLEFLNLLTPFLSIALNNGIYSSRLKREIHDRIQVQQELERANRKLEQLSSLDGLTQISNRREFERCLLELLREATEREQTVGVFMFDIDNFKKYNDTYGHLQGDEALKSVASIVQEHLIATGGISARFGGEEFIGACIGLSSSECALLGEKICAEVRALGMEHSAVSLGILTLSIGVAVGEGATLSDKSLLMRRADAALYEAKNTGKNKTVLHLDFGESEERENDISD